jgi:hypothetical protein
VVGFVIKGWLDLVINWERGVVVLKENEEEEHGTKNY